MMHSLIVSADTRAVSSPRPVRRHVNNAWSWGWFISQLVKIFLLFIISAAGGEETSDGQYHGSILSGNFAGKLGNLGSRLRATEQRCQQHSTIYVCKIRKNTESKKARALHFPVSGYDIACRCSPCLCVWWEHVSVSVCEPGGRVRCPVAGVSLHAGAKCKYC